MIAQGFALALAAVVVSASQLPAAEQQATSTEDAIDAQFDAMSRAITELEAQRSRNATTPAPPLISFDVAVDIPKDPPPTPTPSSENNSCSGPLCARPRADIDRRRDARPAGDTRVTTAERLTNLVPVVLLIVGIALALTLYCFLRPRWRTYATSARRIASGYWREIGIFTLLSAILVRLW